jgi:hypothetical protein
MSAPVSPTAGTLIARRAPAARERHDSPAPPLAPALRRQRRRWLAEAERTRGEARIWAAECPAIARQLEAEAQRLERKAGGPAPSPAEMPEATDPSGWGPELESAYRAWRAAWV